MTARRVVASIAVAFALVFLSSEVNAAGVQELYNTQDSGRIVFGDTATAAGVGRIVEDTAQGRLLGRRAALTDARRNLLILRQKLIREHGVAGSGISRVSGRVAGVRVHSERVIDGLYFLQVDMPLDKLMEGVVRIE